MTAEDGSCVTGLSTPEAIKYFLGNLEFYGYTREIFFRSSQVVGVRYEKTGRQEFRQAHEDTVAGGGDLDEEESRVEEKKKEEQERDEVNGGEVQSARKTQVAGKTSDEGTFTNKGTETSKVKGVENSNAINCKGVPFSEECVYGGETMINDQIQIKHIGPLSGLVNSLNIGPFQKGEGVELDQGINLGVKSELGLKHMKTIEENKDGDSRSFDGQEDLENHQKEMLMEGVQDEAKRKKDNHSRNPSGLGAKSKRKGDGNTFGRSRVSFHYLKHLARSNVQTKGGRKRQGRNSESRSQGRAESFKSGASGQNQIAVVVGAYEVEASTVLIGRVSRVEITVISGAIVVVDVTVIGSYVSIQRLKTLWDRIWDWSCVSEGCQWGLLGVHRAAGFSLLDASIGLGLCLANLSFILPVWWPFVLKLFFIVRSGLGMLVACSNIKLIYLPFRSESVIHQKTNSNSGCGIPLISRRHHHTGQCLLCFKFLDLPLICVTFLL
ncbi:hypothetical protein L6452_05955 [Arctium lappa]|uniref:Uncharacterized protein n=1 Tax=Arctium lappa TaxID=4217 RepID=A0ACB9EHC3_ARCLA|nr:hypothetical protein L6452_05955 [Arctium lappa]